MPYTRPLWSSSRTEEADTDPSNTTRAFRRVRRFLFTAFVIGFVVLPLAVGHFGSLTVEPRRWISHGTVVDITPHPIPPLASADAAESGQVILDSGAGDARMPVVGMRWDDGYAVLTGPAQVLPSASTHILRDYRVLDGIAPPPGTDVELDEYAFPDDADEVGASPVIIPTLEDDYEFLPSWEFPNPTSSTSGQTWFIHVHGLSMTRGEATRMVDGLKPYGLPALSISYRGDGIGPARNRTTFGFGEAADVKAAMQWVLLNRDRTAKFVLVGYSLGGSAVLAAAQDTAYEPLIRAIVLDSPLLDLGVSTCRTVHRYAPETISGLSNPICRVATPLIAVFASPFRPRVTHLRATPPVPTLLLQGTYDIITPVDGAREFAANHEGVVELIEFPASHTRIYNRHQLWYLRAIHRWLVEQDLAGEELPHLVLGLTPAALRPPDHLAPHVSPVDPHAVALPPALGPIFGPVGVAPSGSAAPSEPAEGDEQPSPTPSPAPSQP